MCWRYTHLPKAQSRYRITASEQGAPLNSGHARSTFTTQASVIRAPHHVSLRHTMRGDVGEQVLWPRTTSLTLVRPVLSTSDHG